ncbi:MAG: hypothetical protein PHT12_06645, partial [Patescibacteria group bacterium]|nr:hypothetical protein [Patescibacteria group bacterium]
CDQQKADCQAYCSSERTGCLLNCNDIWCSHEKAACQATCEAESVSCVEKCDSQHHDCEDDDDDGDDDGCSKKGKVAVCHHEDTHWVNLCLPEPAVDAHLTVHQSRGDHRGKCTEDDRRGKPSCHIGCGHSHAKPSCS